MSILKVSGQFDAEGLAFVRETLERHLKDPAPSIWLIADDGEPVGVAYCAPEAVASGTWNLLLLWTREDRQGQGLGTQLLDHLKLELQSRAGRLLMVETSSMPAFAGARSFYAKSGFCHEATIRNFFEAQDDKLIFTQPLTGTPAPSGTAVQALPS